MEDKYNFEIYNNKIDLKNFINNPEEINKPIIIYIKDINNNSLNIRLKKPFDYYINYNNIKENEFIYFSINIDTNKKEDKKKTILENTFNEIKKYIELNIRENYTTIVNIKPIYFQNNKRPNTKTFDCKFIPDIKTHNHRIYEIKKYMVTTLWNRERFNFERAKKGYTDLSTFKYKLINADKNNTKLDLYLDLEPVIKIYDKIDNENKIYKRNIKFEYNIRQIYFVDVDIVPDPLF
jgi:hypothetical protein